MYCSLESAYGWESETLSTDHVHAALGELVD
jgi:hypothetical protein